MVLYTIIPPEYIFGDECNDTPEKTNETEEFEIQKNGIRFLVSPMPGGQAKINRLISTDPNDFLTPEWQPGSMISFF